MTVRPSKILTCALFEKRTEFAKILLFNYIYVDIIFAEIPAVQTKARIGKNGRNGGKVRAEQKVSKSIPLIKFV